MVKSAIVITAAALLAGCATVAPEPVVTPVKNLRFTAYAESATDVSNAQQKAMRAARFECGKHGLDVFPDNAASQVDYGFGKMGYTLVFTCAKLNK